MPPVFALAPAHGIPGFLDYSTSEHLKIYKQGVSKLTGENLFTCEADQLFRFLRKVEDRSNEMGWMDGILDVTTSDEDADVEEIENLILNYGSITLEQVIESEKRYISLEQRKAQDTYMLHHCLMASLSDEAKEKVLIWSDDYQIEIDDKRYSSRVALLKVIIRESHIDTNASANQIRTKLSNLDECIATVEYDVGKFNQHVKLLVQALTARNQSTSDLLINLFKGYSAVSDEAFRGWLNRKQEAHEEGREEITPDQLMKSAKNKFDTLKENGKWNAPTAAEQIVALEAKLTSTIKNIDKKVKFELNKGRNKGQNKSKGDAKDGRKGNKSKGKTDDHPKTWAPPKSGDKKIKEYKGHQWHWCGKDTGGKCEKWRAHDPGECKGIADGDYGDSKGKRPADKKKKGSVEKKLRVARAYVAKLEQRQRVDDNDETEERRNRLTPRVGQLHNGCAGRDTPYNATSPVLASTRYPHNVNPHACADDKHNNKTREDDSDGDHMVQGAV